MAASNVVCSGSCTNTIWSRSRPSKRRLRSTERRNWAPLIELAHRRGIGVLNAAPYGSGLLAKGPQAYPRYAYSDAPEDLIRRARAIADVCQESGVPLAAAALQFSLRDSRITSTIVGMSRPERIRQTLQLASVDIPTEPWSRLEEHVGPPLDREAVRWRRE